jgi:PAS domain S-box-containing protein
MHQSIRRSGEIVARLLTPRTEEERQKRAAHAFALLLVALVATVKQFTEVTASDAPFGLYALAVAASAAYGGFAPAAVATLAAMLLGGVELTRGDVQARLVFGAEGLALAALVSAIMSRLRERDARLRAADVAITDLRERDRRGRVLAAALVHLQDAARDTAVIVLDDRGAIAEWPSSAARLYGYPRERMAGASPASLFADEPSAEIVGGWLREARASGSLHRAGVHRREDGAEMHVELELKPFHNGDARGFTLSVHDLAKVLEWDDYRLAAGSAQAALQRAADDARQQLAALESLTDPSLNPFEGPAMVVELLERLRAAVQAEGVGLGQPGRLTAGVLAARGVQPAGARVGADTLHVVPGRAAVVHNDPARVQQLSLLRWPSDVASMLVVPVVHDGRVLSTIEVVSVRPRQVSEWDVALARVAADRLAPVLAPQQGLAARAS